MERVGLCLSTRLNITLNATLAFFIIYLIRVQFSVSILCMVRDIPLNSDHGGSSSINISAVTLVPMVDSSHINESNYESQTNLRDQCGGQLAERASYNLKGEFNWSKSLRGWMLSAFFWGYAVTQIPGGWLAERFGSKMVVGVGMFVANTAHMLIPVGARIHPYLVIVLRVVVGLGHGVMFPSLHCLFGKWAPPLERSILMAPTYAGGILASCLALGLTGFICDIPWDHGWPSVFYIYGAFSFIWLLLWCIFVYSKPSQHPRISDEEKQYIVQSIGPSAYAKRMDTPWKAIFTSRAVWAINVAHFCDNWAQYTVLTSVPTYMQEVLHFDIHTNGVLTAVPYAVMYIATVSTCQLADCLRRNKILTTTGVRKTFQSIGFVVPAVFIVALGFVTCRQRYLAVIFLTISVGFQAFGRSAFSINHVDIAPRFSGLLCGISNTIATVPGMVAPYLAAALTTQGTQEEWQIVFFICGAVFMVGLVVYACCASGEEQPWAKLSHSAQPEAIELTVNM